MCLLAITSACILKDTLRSNTQVFLVFIFSIFVLLTNCQFSFISLITCFHQYKPSPREHQRLSGLIVNCRFAVLLQSLVQVDLSNSVFAVKSFTFRFSFQSCLFSTRRSFLNTKTFLV